MSDIGSTRIIWSKSGYFAMFRLVGSRQCEVNKDGKRAHFVSIEDAGAAAGVALKAAHEAREKGRQREKDKATR